LVCNNFEVCFCFVVVSEPGVEEEWVRYSRKLVYRCLAT